MPTKGKNNRVIFSASELEYIKREYPTGTCNDIAEHLGVSVPVVSKTARELGLRKSESWHAFNFSDRYVRNYAHHQRKLRV